MWDEKVNISQAVRAQGGLALHIYGLQGRREYGFAMERIVGIGLILSS